MSTAPPGRQCEWEQRADGGQDGSSHLGIKRITFGGRAVSGWEEGMREKSKGYRVYTL